MFFFIFLNLDSLGLVWADMGDAISKQYVGTPTKTDCLRYVMSGKGGMGRRGMRRDEEKEGKGEERRRDDGGRKEGRKEEGIATHSA
jgi:hypothetical protein